MRHAQIPNKFTIGLERPTLQLRILDCFVTERTIFRDESVSTKHNATVSDLVGYVSSWSAFQNYQNQEGEKKASELLHSLEQELV